MTDAHAAFTAEVVAHVAADRGFVIAVTIDAGTPPETAAARVADLLASIDDLSLAGGHAGYVGHYRADLVDGRVEIHMAPKTETAAPTTSEETS